MTEAVTEDALPRREGTEDDIAGIRIYYHGADRVRRHIDWDRRLMAVEAVALKKVARISPRQGLDAMVDYLGDPEATQAMIWMLRKHRGAETDLRLGQVEFDLMSLRDEWIDGDGVELDIPDPELDPDAVDAAAAALRQVLPNLPAEDARMLARGAVRAARPAEPEGEGGAGGQPASPSSSPTT